MKVGVALTWNQSDTLREASRHWRVFDSTSEVMFIVACNMEDAAIFHSQSSCSHMLVKDLKAKAALALEAAVILEMIESTKGRTP